MQWTVEKLKSMSVHERHQLWKNARAKSSIEATTLRKLIEHCGLPYSEPGPLRATDPIVEKMIEVINSKEAISAAIEATEAGLPALQGVEPLLVQALGVDYGPHNRGTMEAGFWVADMMHRQGYRNSGKKGGLPSNCVAKTAEIFIPNSPFPKGE